MTKKNKLFSLIELITVIAIITVLLAVTIGVFSLVRDRMNNSKTRAIIKQLDIALQSYKLEQGYYFIDVSANGTDFPNLSSGSQTANDINSAWWFKFNFNNAVDTEFVKNFEYQSLVGSKNITNKLPDGTTLNYYYIKDAWDRPLLYKYPGIFNPEMFDPWFSRQRRQIRR